MYINGSGKSQPNSLAALLINVSNFAISSASKSLAIPPTGNGKNSITFPSATITCPPPFSI